MNKEQWEKSFAGYHKDAPGHLKSEAKKLVAHKMSKRDAEIARINKASAAHGSARKAKGPNPAAEGDRSTKVVSGLSSKDAAARVAMLKAKATGEYRPRWASPKK